MEVGDVDAIKTHNPFAVNVMYVSREMGVPLKGMNEYGSSLDFGHPRGPTGARLIAKLIEQLKMRGGTSFLTGCVVGDTAAALRVEG